MGLELWQVKYQETEGVWLRWYDAAGNWILTPTERTEQERQQADRLAARSRELGIDPEQL